MPLDPVEVIENLLDALHDFAFVHDTPEWKAKYQSVWDVIEDNEDDDAIAYALEHMQILLERKFDNAE